MTSVFKYNNIPFVYIYIVIGDPVIKKGFVYIYIVIGDPVIKKGFVYIYIVIGDPVIKKGLNPINRLNPTRTWISNDIYRDSFCLQ